MSEPIWALGTMSGTSLDGVDAAMLQTDGVDIFDFGKTGYRAYTPDERATLRAALGTMSGPAEDAAAEVVEIAHAELLSRFEDAAVIGFHGQTTFHDPGNGHTHQAGSGLVLAKTLETPVVWDFRSTDVDLGGQGAPLAPFYHFALARHLKMDRPVAFLNLGGVGNITWLDPSVGDPAGRGACLAFDTGPANALIDDLCAERTSLAMDRDGALTKAGTVSHTALDAMKRHPYLLKSAPKSLDRNDFSSWRDLVEHLGTADAVATLAAGTVHAIRMAMDHCPSQPSTMLVSGGGRHNQGMMAMLADQMPCPVKPVEAFGLNGDMLEAQAFAYLAVRVLRGLPTSAPGTTGVAAPVGGGIVSNPD